MLMTFVEGHLRLDIWDTAGDSYWSPMSDVKADFELARTMLEAHAAPQPPDQFDAMRKAVDLAFHRAGT